MSGLDENATATPRACPSQECKSFLNVKPRELNVEPQDLRISMDELQRDISEKRILSDVAVEESLGENWPSHFCLTCCIPPAEIDSSTIALFLK